MSAVFFTMNYILWPTMPEMADQKEILTNLVTQDSKITNFQIIPVITENWNADLSPWKFEDEKNSFPGNADAFLEKLLATIQSLHTNQDDRLFIAGYSLAGLFSLWAASQSDIFLGVASCSGSLWFPGFMEAELMPKCPEVYLSLGDKECRTKHPLMSLVEIITKEYAKTLKESGNYDSVLFEMNQGNHFANALERTAKAMAFLIQP